MNDKRKEYMREYREKNKDKLKAYNQAYEQINKATRTLQKKINDLTYRQKNKDQIKKKQRVPERRFCNAKSAAKKRGIDFSISFDEWSLEVAKPCVYCEGQLGKKSETCVGCDRKDNTLGYISGNILSCCKFCNFVKGDRLTFEETNAAIQAILAVRKKNKILG